MRENIDETEYRYAKAGQGGGYWSKREELTYTTFDQLAKG